MRHFAVKATLLALLAFCLVPAGRAQSSGGKDQSLDKNAPDKSKVGGPLTKKELDAYKQVYEARGKDPMHLIQVSEDFLAKYPTSYYAGAVYSELAGVYFQVNDQDKFMASAAKALEINPDNIDVLPLIAMVIPRRVSSKTPDAAQQLQQAQTYANHAIDLLTALAKPADMDDAQFQKVKNNKLALCHSGLGVIAIKQNKFPVAVTELKQATELSDSPDPVDFYLLGAADDALNHFTGATAAYTKCADNGPMQSQCKAGLEQVKKDSQNKLDVPE